MTTPIDLDEMERIGNAATAAPWNLTAPIYGEYSEQDRANDEWTVYARNKWQALVDELRAARERIEYLEDELAAETWKRR